MKYIVDFNVTITHTIEIEADNATDAKMYAREIAHSDVIQGLAEEIATKDLSGACVEINDIIDDNGQYIYDGIGIF